VQPKTIPFDYVFEFKLNGKDATNTQDVVKLQDVVEISMQGMFVAVSMGYSFVLDERKTSRSFAPVIDQVTSPQAPVLVPIPSGTLAANGGLLIAGMPNAEITILRLTDTTSDKATQPIAGGDISFIAADLTPAVGITDVLRIGADGTAVFLFANPPVANTSFRIWDRRNNFLSESVDLSTFVIGPNPVTRRLPGAGDDTVDIYGPVADANIFLLKSNGQRETMEDQFGGTVFHLALDKAWGPFIGTEQVKLHLAGVPRKLSAGDVLLVQSAAAGLGHSTFPISNPRLSTIPFDAIARGLASTNVGLTSGFRLSQRAAKIFAANPPLSQVDPDILSKAFEPACGAEGVSFLYSIDVVSTGRELQNKPIHNIAGLGIANGDRPFRPFARPIAFEPRSVIRIQIEELSTLPGTLYIVLQGYKTLGTGRIPE
jgi:hypothetical protein